MPDVFIAKEKKEEAKPKLQTSMPPLVSKPPQYVKSSAENQRLFKKISSLSFIFRPENLRFETQEKEEKIILLVRRHPLTILPWFLLAFLIIMMSSVIFKLTNFFPSRFHIFTLLLWYLFTFAFVFEKFLTWFFNVDIITDERVIDIDFPTLLYRNIKETKIDKIQDVNVKTGGYVRSLFSFGDVLVQTAGAIPEICFEDVPHPEKIANILNQTMLEEEQEKLEGRAK